MDSLSRSSQYDSANVAPPFYSLFYGLKGQSGYACTYRSKYEENKGPTSGLEPPTYSLRVIGHALRALAGGCRCRIDKPASFLCLAACCTLLRSQWYQSGINRGVVPSRSCSLAHASEVRSAPSRARQHTGNPRPILSLNTQHGPSYRRRDAEALGSVTYSCSSLPLVIPRVSATKRRWSSADYSAEKLVIVVHG